MKIKWKQHQSIILILLVSVAAIGSGCSKGLSRYSDDKNGFSVGYPKDWQTTEVTQTGIAVTFASPSDGDGDDFTETFSVSAGDIPEGLDSKAFAKMALKAPETYIEGYSGIDEKPVSVGSLKGYLVIYSGKLGDRKLVFKQAFFVKNTQGYSVIFTFAADKYPLYQTASDQVINSFSLK
jgi:hypothetical protein